MDFETLWSIHERKDKEKMKSKRTLRMAIISTLVLSISFTAGSFATKILFQQDKIDYAFQLDQELVGTWQAVDFVDRIEAFSPTIKTNQSDAIADFAFETLAFTSEGNTMFSLDGEALSPGGFTFTKGHILHTADKTDASYEIKNIDGHDYLFMQWKSGDYVYDFKVPKYYVLMRIDQVDHKDTKPVNLRNDNTDLEFVNDEALLGRWKSVNFVVNKDDFTTQQSPSHYELVLEGIDVLDDGKVVANFKDTFPKNDAYEWTNGKILSPEHSCVEGYYIEEINGKDYLFFPWISGDVIYRNMPAAYYVMERVE